MLFIKNERTNASNTYVTKLASKNKIHRCKAETFNSFHKSVTCYSLLFLAICKSTLCHFLYIINKSVVLGSKRPVESICHLRE